MSRNEALYCETPTWVAAIAACSSNSLYRHEDWSDAMDSGTNSWILLTTRDTSRQRFDAMVAMLAASVRESGKKPSDCESTPCGVDSDRHATPRL